MQEAERTMLSAREQQAGMRLACSVYPVEELTVAITTPSSIGISKGTWTPESSSTSVPNDGWIRKYCLQLAEPVMEDHRSELQRLNDQTQTAQTLATPLVLTSLATALQNEKRLITVVESSYPGHDARVVSVEAGDSSARLYGCAVDIGTTTVAVYLADLTKHCHLDTIAGSNTQAMFGADVISRIGHGMEHGMTAGTDAIRTQINQMINVLAARNRIASTELYRIVLVGNTTMLHFLMGTNPAGIAMAPFIPIFTEELIVPATSLGLSVNCAAEAHLVPGISAYVGADITAGILSSGIMDSLGPSLFLDIGTNGEIVLKHGSTLWTCSTAAGPAFEGAKIRWGAGGIDGAVDSYTVADSSLHYTTIGGGPPLGICGAGLVDILALLIRQGIVDNKGRMSTAGHYRATAGMTTPLVQSLLARLTEVDGLPAFIVVPAIASAVAEDITLTQKDVREVQLAKAAVAAGIDTLLEQAGLAIADLQHIFLAGGFGSYVSKESAGCIGLIPESILDKTIVVGNAAGKGALHTLFSRNSSSQLSQIIAAARYIELSNSPLFQKHFMARMAF
jgi:uncharacterized 2Fe-2S/4Fe-4S cluster protein (DUF4445 family)